MGVSTATTKNIVLDAGVVYLNYGLVDERILGATSGGNTFTVEREVREIEIDGAKGKVKGLRRVTSENANLTVNLKEMSAENIKLALNGQIDNTGIDHDVITSKGSISDSDYLENVAIVAPVLGQSNPCIIVLHNALSDGDSLEMSLEDDNESTIELQLSAHYDPTDLDTPIYEVRYPKAV